MDYRFQPQLGMSYEESLQEASRRNFFTDAACLVTRNLQGVLDVYERQVIDNGIAGLLNGIGLTAGGYGAVIIATGGGSAALAVAAAVGTVLMGVGITSTAIYGLHVATGGNFFRSRKEMEEYENIWSFPGGSYTIPNLYTDLLLNRGPAVFLMRGDINMLRDGLDKLRESLECSESPAERGPHSVGDQGGTALGIYDGVLSGDQQKELDKLAESGRAMLQELNQKKPAARQRQLQKETPVAPDGKFKAPEIQMILRLRLSDRGSDRDRSDGIEPMFKGDVPNPTDRSKTMVA